MTSNSITFFSNFRTDEKFQSIKTSRFVIVFFCSLFRSNMSDFHSLVCLQASTIPNAGAGLFVRGRAYKKNSPVIDYHGKYVRQSSARARSGADETYHMELPPMCSNFFYVDASHKCYCHQILPKGRYINHSHTLSNLFPVSCCLSSSSSFPVIVFFASRSIKKGEELFFPYSPHHNFGDS